MPLAPGRFSKRISISNPCSKLAFKRIWKGHFQGARGIGQCLDANCGVNHSSELSGIGVSSFSTDWLFLDFLVDGTVHAQAILAAYSHENVMQNATGVRPACWQPGRKSRLCCFYEVLHWFSSNFIGAVCSLAVFAIHGFADFSRNIHG